MDFITAAIVLFIFVCIIFPQLVKNRAQFYLAVASVMLIIIVYSLEWMFSGGFHTLLIFIHAVLVFAAFLLVILGTGGLSLGELTGEFKEAFDAVRKGEEKPVVVPLTGAKPVAKAPVEVPTQRFTITDPAAAAARAARQADEGSIPLE